MSFGGGAAGRLLARTPPRPRPPVAMPHALPAEAPVDALRWSRRSPHLSSPTRSLDSPVDSLRGRRGACSFVHALWEPGEGARAKRILRWCACTKMLEISRKFLKKTKLGIHIIPGFATTQDIKIAISVGVDVFRVASHCTEADITQKHIEFIRN